MTGAARDARTPTRLGAGRKALLAGLLAVVSLVLLDLLLRAYLMLAGLPASPGALRAEIHDLAVTVTERVHTFEGQPDTPPEPEAAVKEGDIVHPFTGFDLAHGLADVQREVERFRSRSQRDDFDLLVLGGSVAANFGNAVPKLVAPLLQQDPRLRGRKVHVINHARGGFRQPQQTALLLYLFASGYRPDAVVEIDGFNEVALGLFNHRKGASPVYPSIAHWGRVAQADRDQTEALPDLFTMLNGQRQAHEVSAFAERWKLYYSSVLGSLAVWKLQRVKMAYSSAYSRYVSWLMRTPEAGQVSPTRGPAFPGTDDEALDYLVASWVASSLNLDAICKARAVPYLHVLQPTLHDPGAKPMTEEEIRKGTADPAWIDGAEAGYPKLREASRRLVEQGVPFVDLSRMFADETETVYLDVCHYNPKGLATFSAAVAEKLLDQLPSE